MAGVSLVSDEFYRRHLAALRHWFQYAQAVPERQRRHVAARVRFAARVLMKSDAAGVTPEERAEAERLIDDSAGWLTRHRLDAAAVRRRVEAEALGPVKPCDKCGQLTTGPQCEKCGREFVAFLDSLLITPPEVKPCSTE